MPLAALLLDVDHVLLDTHALFARAAASATEDAPHATRATTTDGETTEGDILHAGGDPAPPTSTPLRPDAPPALQALASRMMRHRRARLDAARAARLELVDGARALVDAATRRGLRIGILAGPDRELFEALDAASDGALRSLGTVLVDAPTPGHSTHEGPLHRAAATLGLFGPQCAVVSATTVPLHAGRNAGVVGVGISGLMRERHLRAAGARVVHPSSAALAADLDAALDLLAPGDAPLTRPLAERLMREALSVAREGMEAGEAPIGCVLARGDGSIIARGYNEMQRSQNKTAHAEIVTFARAAGRVPLDARDLILVSTLEPCVMCTGAAMESAVDAVVYALRAPADSGTGRVQSPESPESQMPRIVGDVLAAESRALFEEWMRRHGDTPQAAYIRQLLALTS